MRRAVIALPLALAFVCGCSDEDIAEPVQRLIVDSREIDFTRVERNTAARLSALFSNQGERPVTITGITQGETWNDAFMWTGIPTPHTLDPGEDIRLMIIYQPRDVGVDVAELLIHSDDPVVPVFTLRLKGQGI